MGWAEHDSQSGDWLLYIRVTPRARHDVLQPGEQRLQARLRAPPADGKANQALCRLLANRLGVPRSAVRVVKGERGREKTVRISAEVAWPEELVQPRGGRID